MCYTNHIHKILLFLTPAYVYCIFSILVPQISLQSYVTRKPYLTPLELLPCRVYTLSKSNFLIFSTQCYIITNPVELKQSFQPFHKTQLQFWCSPISTVVNMCVLFFFILNDGPVATGQYSEGPATGHLDTGFSWFPVPRSKCWDGSQDSKLPLHASHVALPT